LVDKIKSYEEIQDSDFAPLEIPLKLNQTEFLLTDLKPDQEDVAYAILDGLNRFMTCEDLKTFVPIRVTINGGGGSGKSVVINTLVSVLRKMFQITRVASVFAPSGVAAFNVRGTTVHYFFGMGCSYRDYEGPMPEKKLALLQRRCRYLLMMIFDERSLLEAKTVGEACEIASEALFGGYCKRAPWGACPCVVFVGDDYQLPSIGPGVFKILNSARKPYSRMKEYGFGQLLQCAQTVYELSGSKRILKDDASGLALNNRLRVGEPTESDMSKLISLDLENVKARCGTEVVEEIEQKAIYLYATNLKIRKKNFERLRAEHSASKPVAIMKRQSESYKNHGRAIAGHFQTDRGKDDGTPMSSIFCRGAKVRLSPNNFCPQWGLYNGAMGIVEEIIFAEGKNPNSGDLPRYVVVDFKHYCGPVWDKNRPTVSSTVFMFVKYLQWAFYKGLYFFLFLFVIRISVCSDSS